MEQQEAYTIEEILKFIGLILLLALVAFILEDSIDEIQEDVFEYFTPPSMSG